VSTVVVAGVTAFGKREQREGMLAVVAKPRRHANGLLESLTFAPRSPRA